MVLKKQEIKQGIKGGGKLKVLIATGIFPPDIGGPATYVEALCEELPKQGCEVKVVTYGEKKFSISNFQFSNPIVSRSLSRKKRGSGGRDKSQISNLKFQIPVYCIARNQNILFRYFKYFWQVWKLIPWADVVYVQGPVSEGLPSVLACKARGKEYILKIVGDYAWEQGRQRFGVKDLLGDFQNKKYCWQVELMRQVQRIVARKARIIITPSQYLKNIVKQWNIDDEKIKVIYNSIKGVDSILSKAEAKSKIGLSGFVILSVGRFVTWKGFGLLIELMPELLKINPEFKLVIIGDGPERKNLEFKIKNFKLSDKVKLIGSVEQKRLWQYMQIADIFVLNTGYEGLSHVIIEAMQFRLPVATTNIGGNPEIVQHGKTGLLFEYNNKQEIKNAILLLWRDKDKRKNLIENAEKNLNKFNKQTMLSNTIQVLRQFYESF